jgi:hypothetical protein
MKDIFEEFRADHPGYFRIGEENHFPWDRTDNSVWYALFAPFNNEIQYVGYTPAKSSKRKLLEAITTIKGSLILIGVWHGERRTDLFFLDIKTAIKHLKEVT